MKANKPRKTKQQQRIYCNGAKINSVRKAKQQPTINTSQRFSNAQRANRSNNSEQDATLRCSDVQWRTRCKVAATNTVKRAATTTANTLQSCGNEQRANSNDNNQERAKSYDDHEHATKLQQRTVCKEQQRPRTHCRLSAVSRKQEQ